jgi:hypothetical protein
MGLCADHTCRVHSYLYVNTFHPTYFLFAVRRRDSAKEVALAWHPYKYYTHVNYLAQMTPSEEDELQVIAIMKALSLF